jgi:pilus assembly protein CpaB
MKLSRGIQYMALAVVAGLTATFLIHRYVSLKTHVEVKPTGQVVVAAKDVSPGTALNSGVLRLVSWPKELIPQKAAVSLREVEGRVVTIPLIQGEPVLISKLAPEGTAAGLGALLEENQRAFTIRVDDVSGVAGFIHPGDRVDVLMDLPMPGQQNEHFSKTILQNVVVLTTGQTWEQKPEQPKPVVVNTVTLALVPEQAEVLNLASNQGKIRLALRNRNNAQTIATRGVATSSLIGQTSTAPAGAVHPAPGAGAPHVEVIKGMGRSRTEL